MTEEKPWTEQNILDELREWNFVGRDEWEFVFSEAEALDLLRTYRQQIEREAREEGILEGEKRARERLDANLADTGRG